MAEGSLSYDSDLSEPDDPGVMDIESNSTMNFDNGKSLSPSPFNGNLFAETITTTEGYRAMQALMHDQSTPESRAEILLMYPELQLIANQANFHQTGNMSCSNKAMTYPPVNSQSNNPLKRMHLDATTTNLQANGNLTNDDFIYPKKTARRAVNIGNAPQAINTSNRYNSLNSLTSSQIDGATPNNSNDTAAVHNAVKVPRIPPSGGLPTQGKHGLHNPEVPQ